ncbi:hypothetical protein HAX54_029451 [Datura stramonium]|uniref:Uncharacterized protein n=1 Tax=Datura stramonium TaxID=4076 RepID=A0ABS8V868_DATST|nr:hypothetical protein [Datura stramonium]
MVSWHRKAAKDGPAIRFGAQAIEPHGLNWFNTQKEANYASENWIDEGRLAFEFPTIRASSMSWELD